jgi:hypothetical protein
MTNVVREQLNQTPDSRIRMMLMCMLGLLAFLIIDWAYAKTKVEIDGLQTQITNLNNEIITNKALIEQVPALAANVKSIQQELVVYKEKQSQSSDSITACKERDVLAMLQDFTIEGGPFSGFTVNTNPNLHGMVETVYTIRFEGLYENVLKGFYGLDRSACMNHVKLVDISRVEAEPDVIRGSIQLHVYHTKVQAP